MADKASAAEPVITNIEAALTEMTAEVVAVYVSSNRVPAGDVPGLIAAVHAALDGLARPFHLDAPSIRPTPPVPIRRTVTDGYIISLEDGKPYKALKRHLTKLGMTPDRYREKWGLPYDYPVVAPAYARARSELAKTMGLGNMRRER